MQGRGLGIKFDPLAKEFARRNFKGAGAYFWQAVRLVGFDESERLKNKVEKPAVGFKESADIFRRRFLQKHLVKNIQDRKSVV